MAACVIPKKKREEMSKKADNIDNGEGDWKWNPSHIFCEERETAPSTPPKSRLRRAERFESPYAQVAPNPPVHTARSPNPTNLVRNPTSPLDSFYGSSKALPEEENKKPLHNFVEFKRANLWSKQ